MRVRRKGLSRRRFLATAGKGIVASSVAGGFPSIVPASVLGATAPSKLITVGAIGTGRISRTHDLPGVWRNEGARIVAVCDLDARRLEEAKTLVSGEYSRRSGKAYDGVMGYGDYRELLANRDVDAVLISTPDHCHAIIARQAVEAGQGGDLQKPESGTTAGGRGRPATG